MGSGVGRQHDAVLGGLDGVGAEVAGDDAGHERRHVGALAGELDDGADDDLRLVRRREADEPAVVGAVGILGGARLARDSE